MSDKTVELILRTAMGLFTNKGYFNTTIRDLAREAAISTGAVYHHFRSKEEIATELFERTTAYLYEEIRGALDKHPDVEDKVYWTIRTMLRIADEDMDIMEYSMYLKHREIIPGGRTISSSQYSVYLKKMLMNEMKAGTIRKMNADLALVCLTAMPTRLIKLKCDGAFKGGLERHSGQIFECVWESLRARQ